MSEKIRLAPAVAVEGKYDKIQLENIVDAVILVTDGFQIYKRPERLELLRHYARTTGLCIMTDADSAGFQIRGFLKGAIPEGRLYHVYIPGIHGKERRKPAPSAEGLLGVEGMDRETLLFALERAGVLDETPRPPGNITPGLLYQCGLTGTPDCSARRDALLAALRLPGHLSVKGLCDVLGTLTDAEHLPEFLAALEKEGGL